MRQKWLATLAVTLASALSVAAQEQPYVARSQLGIVVSDAVEASLVGAQALAQGGNAFDAAIVTSLALAVTRPQSTGLGGGGFLVAYVARDKRFVALDFREMAPLSATPERYEKLLAEAGDGPPPTLYGGNAVAVPGLPAGLAEIHKRYASLPLRDLIGLMLFLTDAGFTVNEQFQADCRQAISVYEKWPVLKEKYPTLYHTLLNDGTPPAVGQRARRKDLRAALVMIADQGFESCYQGELATAIIEAVNAAGGKLTAEDLANYRVREREPLRGQYRDYAVLTMPPPSSGGVALLETLNILRAAGGPAQTQPVVPSAHTLVEAFKHAFADRARWLGDPDFSSPPVARLISTQYAAELAARILPNATLAPDQYGSGRDTTTTPSGAGGTTHFCVADARGNVVAMTETINGLFGSLIVVEPYGIILNNEMDDFTMPGRQPNLYGLVQSEANLVGPRKRPLSSMTPTLVFKQDKPVLALGASGGPRIITAVVQVLSNVLDRGQPLPDAVTALRLHHQWQPDEVYFDQDPPAELLQTLREAGHKISDQQRTAGVQAIQFLPDGTLLGVCDPRKGGRPTPVVE